MWSVFSVVAFLSIFESVFTDNHNETAQNQTGHDFAGTGASFTRNLTASISVSDTDLTTPKSSDFPSVKVNISNRESLEPAEKSENVIEFNTPRKTNGTETNQLNNFRPSPQIETYYEFNKFQVKPAYPEAKTIPIHGTITSDDNEKPRNINIFEQGRSAYGNVNYQNTGGFKANEYSGTTGGAQRNSEASWTTKNDNSGDTPWITRVRFPTGPQLTNNNNNSPYMYIGNPTNQKPSCCQGNNEPLPQYQQTQAFANNPQANQKNSEYLPPIETIRPSLSHNSQYMSHENNRPSFSANNQRGGYLPQTPVPNYSSTGKGDSQHIYESSFSSSGHGEDFNFNKLVEIPKKYSSEGHNTYTTHHKTYETPYNLMEKPSYESHPKTYGGGHGYSTPWKKILKLFATFIPIGLLISALTPTVITVTNANDTTDMPTTRYRSSDDPKKELQNHILSSLDYFEKLNENGCEYRVFCELLLSARNMADSERHVQNLLDNFAKQEIDYKSRADDLRKVFEAVRNQDCKTISCEFIKGPT